MLEKLFPKHFIPKQDRQSYQLYLTHKEDIDQYIQYLEMATRLPVIHRIKQNNIVEAQKKYGFNIFVETGTYLGDMVEAQRDHFEKLISVELSQTLFDQAVERFKTDERIQILQGDSGKVLKEVMKYLQEPALFWLDGHYSAGITAKTDKNTPILEELKTIFSSSYNHGILIDDARLFTGKEDYPSIDELCIMVKEYAPERKVEVADDIIRIMK
jgi:hypothetical protein